MGVSAAHSWWSADGRLLLAGGAEPAQRRVEGLLFDLGGTLDADGLGWGERFETLLRRELPEARREAVSAALTAGEQALLRHPRASELGLEEMVALHVATQLERLAAASPARAARLTKVFHEETSGALARRRPLLARLARRLPLGVVSNGCGNSEKLLRECGIGDLFRAIVDSSLVNAWKPDPRIFEPALSALGLEPGSVAMVGDRLDRDVEGAVAAGLAAVWVSGGRVLDPAHPLAASVSAIVESVDALDPGEST
jgi:putative hydrolase of the HAD superfamily